MRIVVALTKKMAVETHLPETVQFVACIFGEPKDGKVVERGVKCKMARGQMARWLAENQIKSPDELRAFDRLVYQFCHSASERNRKVLLWIQSHGGTGNETAAAGKIF